MSMWRCAGLVLVLLLACQSRESRIEEHSARAEGYFEQEQYAEAKIEYLNWIQLEPDSAAAHFRLGETQLRLAEQGQGDPGDALFQIQEAVRLAPDNLEYRARLGVLEIAAREPERALDQARFILQREPGNAEAWMMQAQAKALQRDVDGQIADLLRAQEFASERPMIPLLLAQAYVRRERYDDAERSLRRLLQIDPSSQSWAYLAGFLIERDRKDEAVKALENAVDVADGDTAKLESQTRLANLYISLGKLEEAEKTMRAALKDRPGDAELLSQLARFYVYRGDVKQAEAMLEQQVDQNPGKIEPLITLALFYERLGQADEALDAVGRVLAIEPENEQGLTLRAQYLVGRDPESTSVRAEAQAILDGVLERNPDSLYGLFTQAKFLLAEGKAEPAAEQLRRVLNEQPSANAHYLLATAYVRLQQDDLARAELLEAIQLDSTNPRIRADLAALYLRTGNDDLAVQEADLALQRQPRNPVLLLIAAEALVRSGRETAARKRLDEIPFDELPAPVPALVSAANLYRRLRDDAQARKLVDRALERAPSDLSALQARVLLEAKDDPVAAIRPLDVAIAADPQNAALYAMRGGVRLGLRRPDGSVAFPEETEADLAKAIEMDPSLTAPYLRLAQLYRALGRNDEARKLYEDALERAPGDARIRVEVGAFYEAEGRVDEALAAYREALEIDATNPVAKNNLAWLTATKEGATPADLDRALALAQEAKDESPQVPAYADTLGYVMLKKGRPVAAVSLFKEAIAGFGPGLDRGRSRVHLGEAYEREGNLDDAGEQFGLAAQESPRFVVDQGRFLERTGRLDEAEKLYRQAIDKQPLESLESHNALADLYRRRGRGRQAVRVYESLLERNADFVPAKNNLAFVLAELESPTDRELDRALALAREVRERLPQSPEVADTLGFVLYRRQELTQAADLLKESVEGYAAGPGRAQARYHLALVYQAQGQRDLARAELEKSLAESEAFVGRDRALELQKKLDG